MAVACIAVAWLCPVTAYLGGFVSWPETLIFCGLIVTLALMLLFPNLHARLSMKELSLIAPAVVLNLLMYQIGSWLELPFFLDTVGTIVIGVVYGSQAGVATGMASSLIGSLFSPVSLIFAAVQALVGLAAGITAHLGVFRSALAAAFGGFIIGLPIAILSAPLNAMVFVWSDNGLHQAIIGQVESGNSALIAVIKEVLINAPVGTALASLCAWAVLTLISLRQRRHMMETCIPPKKSAPHLPPTQLV